MSDRFEAAYNELLTLDATERQEALDRHLPWGTPASPAGATNEHVLVNEQYVIGYDDDLRIPLWVAYRLRDSDVAASRERTECFRRDPRLTMTAAAFCADYAEPLFDRGHMVPNADMERSEAAMINTYMFLNMVPQRARFNQQIWAHLEGRVRAWTLVQGEIYVITGAVFDQDGDGARDADTAATRMASNNGDMRVAVPTHYYKILARQLPNERIDTLTILLVHDNTSAPSGSTARDQLLTMRICSINTIEGLTGIDFFPGLDPLTGRTEAIVQQFQATALWPR